MSTTIYDAYRIDATDIIKLRQFCTDIKVGYEEDCMSAYAASTAAEMMSLVEYLPMLKKTDPEGYIKECGNIVKSAGLEGSLAGIPDGESRNKFETILKSRSILDVAQMVTARRLDSKDDYGINAELAVFPLTNGTLLIAFGHTFQDYMSRLHANPESVARKRHDMWDWHYQDQADKPDDISEEIWEARRKTWDRVMPSGIPSKDGLIVQVYNMDQLRIRLFTKPYGDEIKNIMKTSIPGHRLEAYARDKASMAYAKETGLYDPNDYSNMPKLVREFNDRYKLPGSRANKLMQDALDEIKPYMIDFSDEDILDPLFGGQVFDAGDD